MMNPTHIAICEMHDEGITSPSEISRKLGDIPGSSTSQVALTLHRYGRATPEQRASFMTARNRRIYGAVLNGDKEEVKNQGISWKAAREIWSRMAGLLNPPVPLPNQRGKTSVVPKGQIKSTLAQRVDWPENGMSCWACGESNPAVSYEVDHIIPLSKGGEDTLENSQILCRKHNQRKGNRKIPLWDFRKEIQDAGEMAEGYTLYNLPPVALLYAMVNPDRFAQVIGSDNDQFQMAKEA